MYVWTLVKSKDAKKNNEPPIEMGPRAISCEENAAINNIHMLQRR